MSTGANASSRPSKRYWVGGTGSWTAANTTNWANASGGTGGNPVPKLIDLVYIDANSGTSSDIITLQTNQPNCKQLTISGFTGLIAGNQQLNCKGNVSIDASTSNWTWSGGINFTSNQVNTLTVLRQIRNNITLNASGGTLLLAHDHDNSLSSGGSYTISAGTLQTANYAIYCTSFSSTGSGVRALLLGSSLIQITNAWNCSLPTNLTLTAGTSTIKMVGATAVNFGGGGLTYYILWISKTSAAIITMTGSNTFYQIRIDANQQLKFTGGTTQTLQNGMIANGSAGNVITLTSTNTTQFTIISNVSIAVSYCTISYFNFVGIGGATMTASNSTDAGNNSGITFV